MKADVFFLLLHYFLRLNPQKWNYWVNSYYSINNVVIQIYPRVLRKHQAMRRKTNKQKNITNMTPATSELLVWQSHAADIRKRLAYSILPHICVSQRSWRRGCCYNLYTASNDSEIHSKKVIPFSVLFQQYWQKSLSLVLICLEHFFNVAQSSFSTKRTADLRHRTFSSKSTKIEMNNVV